MSAGRKVVISEYGETPPDAIDKHLSIVPQEEPEPESLGPEEVALRVRSCAVGWVDLLMTSGQYQHMAEPPYTPGMEYSGEVLHTGSAVTRFRPGDRVLADGFLTGPRSKGAYRQYGGFASWALAPQGALMPLPESLSFDQGCCILGNYETAYHVLVACGELQAGETVLIHGASGSTGLAAVHLAKLLGARVIATGRSPDKLEEVRAEGADHVLRTDGDNLSTLRDRVKDLTEGRGVDAVYDGVGGELSIASLRCVRFGARFLIVGWAATPFVAKGKGGRGAPGANVLPTNLIMMKGLKVIGCPTVISTHKDPSIRSERLRRIFAWIDEGRLTPRAGPAYAMDRVNEAMMDKWRSRYVGGCILRPNA